MDLKDVPGLRSVLCQLKPWVFQSTLPAQADPLHLLKIMMRFPEAQRLDPFVQGDCTVIYFRAALTWPGHVCLLLTP